MIIDNKANFDWDFLHERIKQGDQRCLARTISLIENEFPGYERLLEKLQSHGACQLIGITGAPGVGKSSLADQLIDQWTSEGKNVAIICVDPSSPFHFGALLGDRLRMNEWYGHPGVFIRSMASRGAIGGLNPKIIEITDLLSAANFDRILIETVGVGQNEVDIAALADTTVLVLMPGSGDDIQAMKSGILEVADIFVVNKADLPNADDLIRYIQAREAFGDNKSGREAVIIRTIATQKTGIKELTQAISRHLAESRQTTRKADLIAEKAWRLILHRKMRMIDRKELHRKIEAQIQNPEFNLYAFIAGY